MIKNTNSLPRFPGSFEHSGPRVFCPPPPPSLAGLGKSVGLASRPFSWSVDQWVGWSVGQWVFQWVGWPDDQSVNQLDGRLVSQGWSIS